MSIYKDLLMSGFSTMEAKYCARNGVVFYGIIGAMVCPVRVIIGGRVVWSNEDQLALS